MYGWMGTILRVDLTRGRVMKQPLDKSEAKDLIGGRGFNSLTLLKELEPGIDPLSPENVLCLSAGLLTGTHLSLSSRIEVSTLSPMTGILGDGNAGSYFPTFLKRAGYDHVVITGKAKSPKYLLIKDEDVELRDASHLWGNTTWKTTDMLQQTHGKDFSVACIGQAGENLVRFASTIIDKYSSAAPGSGAVWGSKNLKAIAVQGTRQVQIAMPKEFARLTSEDKGFLSRDSMLSSVASVYGTHIGVVEWLPNYRYFHKRLTSDEVPMTLRPEAWKKYEVRRATCYGCPIHCVNVFRIPSGKRAGELGSRLQYSAIADLGLNCGILDQIAIMEMANLADAYGMDNIGLGNAIAFAKELYHHGIITREDTGGLSLEWESAESQIELIHEIALRDGFGNLVAEGMYGLARVIGRGAMDYCYHIKGMGRGVFPPGLSALSYATATRGADHLRGRYWAFVPAIRQREPELFALLMDTGMIPNSEMDEHPGKWLINGERAATLADAIGRCKGAINSWACAVPLLWKYPVWDGIAKLLRATTGFEYDTTQVLETADRIYMLEKVFNARLGITREHDRLLQSIEMQGTAEGEAELKKHAEMLTEYYRLHGCNTETGIPTREKLENLGLKYVADDLDNHGPYPVWEGPPLWRLCRYPHGGVRA